MQSFRTADKRELETTMKVRCDKSMRDKKEKISRKYYNYNVKKFICTGNCESCMCGMVQNQSGQWEHVKLAYVG